jgi:3-dehydroquinate synthetase/shikimate kinase
MNALDRHLALVGFMGAGKTTIGREVAKRLGRELVDLDDEIERAEGPIPELFARFGESGFRERESEHAARILERRTPAVVALGGGAVTTAAVREALREHALSVVLDVDVDTAWERVRGSDRPNAQDEAHFRARYEERRPLYDEVADARADDVDGAVLAAGGVEVAPLARLGELVGAEAAVVADSHVLGIHGPAAQVALGERLAATHTLPVGEEAKTVASVERLWNELRLDRRGTLVALGGGCTTDAAGFAAATFLRGVEWVAVPTTLVGQVDAAIGGKTAMNLPAGKNLVGAFHWPARTLIDPALLSTLPERQRAEGMAEVVKTGLLVGEPLWELPDAELVRRCAAYKTAICIRDPHERGVRAVLNLGHTFAHALEAAAAYDAVSHGQAVALGLLAALRLSDQPDLVGEVQRILDPRPVRVDRERAWAALRRDKKGVGGRPKLVLLDAPGRPRHGVELPDDDVRGALDALIRD